MKKLNAGRGFRPQKRNARCSEICLKYEAKSQWGLSRYKIGQKFCNICKVFINYDKDVCPCCEDILKTKSSHYKT